MSALVLLVHISQLRPGQKCACASALLCHELCFTPGQSSAQWCARLEKAQLKNVRLMLSARRPDADTVKGLQGFSARSAPTLSFLFFFSQAEVLDSALRGISGASVSAAEKNRPLKLWLSGFSEKNPL